MINKCKVFAVLVLAFFLIAGPTKAENNSKVVVVLVNSTSLEEINNARMPTLRKLLKQGNLAVGLMNSRSGKSSITRTSGYLTIGAGSKANAGKLGSLAFNENEKFTYNNKEYIARDWYKKVTGYSVKNGQILNLGTANYSRLSDEYEYALIPGLLGKKLSAAGIKRAVIGNADVLNIYHREATLIAMDTTGKVDFGDVSKSGTTQELLKKTDNFLKKASLVVVELGDTARLEYQRDFYTEKKLTALKAKALQNADFFLKGLLSRLNLKKDTIIILSPTPSTLDIKQTNLLTPLFIIRKGQKSFIYSKSTKWPGIADNTDIAPTILSLFSQNVPQEMSGGLLTSRGESDNPIGELREQQMVAWANNTARKPLLTAYVVLIIIAMIIGVVVLFIPNVKPLVYRLIEGLLIYILSTPLLLLLFSLVKYSNHLVLFIVAPIANILLAVVVLAFWRNFLKAFTFLVYSTTLLIIFDVVLGSLLMKNSILGFSPIVGARFYGIGNEYMGVIIGASIFSLSLLKRNLQLPKKIFLILASSLFLLIIFIIGFPGLGANVGGALAATVGFLSVLFYYGQVRFSWKQPIALAGGIVITLALIMFSDKLFGLQTHAGRARDLIASGGLKQAFLIFKRKISANIKLVRYTAWTNVLITILVLLPIMFARPAGAIKVIKEKYPDLWAGAVGVGVGSIAAFVFNDSGVVAAATSLLYAAVIVLYTIMSEEKQTLAVTSK